MKKYNVAIKLISYETLQLNAESKARAKEMAETQEWGLEQVMPNDFLTEPDIKVTRIEEVIMNPRR